jgi:protoporphyrinogen oxidase
VIPTRVAVVGAGVTGLVAARELLARGHHVEVFERWPDVSGQASAFDVGGGVRIERYYHHLFPSDREMIDLHEELLPGTLEWFRSSVAIQSGGRQWPFSGPTDLLRYGPLSPIERVRLGAAVLRLQRRRDWVAMDDIPALDWLQGNVGPQTVERVWRPLLLGKFGDAAGSIPLAWLWSKLVLRRRLEGKGLRGEWLGYPRGSFQAICDALRTDIEHKGGTVHLDREVLSVSRTPEGHRIRTGAPGGYRRAFNPGSVAAGGADADIVLFTTPTHTTRALAAWPAAYDQQLASWEYRAAVVLLLELGRRFTRTYWTNIADPRIPFLGVIEHGNLVPIERYPANYIWISHYVSQDDPIRTLSVDALLARSLPGLQAMVPDFSEADVRRRWLFQEEAAQPIPRVGNRHRILAYRTPLDGLFIANTTQIYPEDRGTNYSVRLGREAAAAIDDQGARPT